MTIEDKLQSLGLSLPDTPAPVASYVPAMRSGALIFSSGQLPTRNGTLAYVGHVETDVSTEDAYQAARLAALNALAAIKSVAGSLDAIAQIVRVTGYVNCGNGFGQQPAVVNGASDLLIEVFGEQGKHARSAVGVAGLPLNAPVEIELVVEVR